MNTDKLRAYALSFPLASEGVKWEHICYMVGEKIFCITSAEDDSPVSLKVTAEDFSLYIDRDGVIQAPHLARGQWICITNRSAVNMEEWEWLIGNSYSLIKAKLPKKFFKDFDPTKNQ